MPSFSTIAAAGVPLTVAHDALIASAESDEYIAMLFFMDVDGYDEADIVPQADMKHYRVDIKARTDLGKDHSKIFDAKDDRDAKRKFRMVCEAVMKIRFSKPALEMPIPEIREPRASNAELPNYGRF